MKFNGFTYATALALLITSMSACDNTNGKGATTASTTQSPDNPAIENILTRTSIRQYQPDRSIGRDTVDLLLRAAMSAPTAVNKQPWAFVVIDSRKSLDSLADVLPYAKMLRQAPLAVVTCGDLSKALEGEAREFWIQDVSAATENLLLAAHALGLGAVWTGVYPSAERTQAVQERLGMPANIIPLAVVPIGYPAHEGEPKDKYKTDNIHFGRW